MLTARDTESVKTCYGLDGAVLAAWVVAESARLIRFKLGPSAEVRFLQFVTSDEVRVVDLTAVERHVGW